MASDWFLQDEEDKVSQAGSKYAYLPLLQGGGVQ